MATWRRWQYQVKAEAVGVPRAVPGSQYESPWHQGYTDPQTNFVARARAVAGVALIASGLFAPVLDKTQEPGNSYESTYHQPWSEPVRLKPRATHFEFATSGYDGTLEPGAGYESQWHQPWSEPVRINPGAISRVYEQQFYTANIGNAASPGTATALVGGIESTIFPDKVFQYQATAFTYSPKVYPGPGTALVSGDSSAVFQRKVILYQSVAFIAPAEIITVNKWFANWSEPSVKSRPKTAYFEFATSGYPATVEPGVYESTSHQPWSEPVRLKPRDAYFEFATSGYPATTEPGSGYESQWHFPWSEPVRLKPRDAYFEFATTGYPATTEPGSPYESQWHFPWSEPVRLKPRATDFTAHYAVPFNEDFGIEAKWHQPWSEPIRRKPFQETGGINNPFVVTTPTPGNATALVGGVESAVFADKKFQYQGIAYTPFTPAPPVGNATALAGGDSSAVFRRAVVLYQSLAYAPFTPAAEVITPDKWWPQYPDFVRSRVLLTASQQAQIPVPFVVATTPPLPIGSQWDGPIFSKVIIPQDVAFVAPFASTENITVDKWFVSFQDPVRVRPALRTGDNQDLFLDTQPFVSFGWFNPLTDPVRVKPALRTGDNQDLFFDPQPFIKIDWFAPYQDPIKLAKPGLITGSQQFLAYDPFPFTNIGWFNWLNEPVRLKPGLPATEQQFLAFDPQPFVKAMDWYVWLGEPKRFLAGLPASEQQAFTAGFVPIIPSVTNWYKSLEEPVRFRVYGVHLQPVSAWTPQNLATIVRFSRGYIIC